MKSKFQEKSTHQYAHIPSTLTQIAYFRITGTYTDLEDMLNICFFVQCFKHRIYALHSNDLFYLPSILEQNIVLYYHFSFFLIIICNIRNSIHVTYVAHIRNEYYHFYEYFYSFSCIFIYFVCFFFCSYSVCRCVFIVSCVEKFSLVNFCRNHCRHCCFLLNRNHCLFHSVFLFSPFDLFL